MYTDENMRNIIGAQKTLEEVLMSEVPNLSLSDLKKQLNLAEKTVENAPIETASVMINFIKIIKAELKKRKAELKKRDEERRKH